MTREPAVATAALPTSHRGSRGERFGAWLREAVIEPFADFMTRRGWIAILVFIVLYKLGEAMAGAMANTLYQELGFSKVDVGDVGNLARVLMPHD